MKKFFPLVLVALIAIVGFVTKDRMRSVANDSFSAGEVLKYKVHYGPINAAEAVIDIAPTLHRVNDRPCYRATVYGKTIGSFDMFLRIRDTWQSYIDTAAILPQRSFRNIEEGNYRKRETVDFDHYQNTVVVEKKKKNRNKEVKNYKIPENVQDIVSGFYYLRTLDYDHMRIGDKVVVRGFFDEENFNMEVIYKGREVVSTKAGNIRAIKLIPRMPKNEMFNGENSIKVYLSDDRNKIPVLIEAEMFVGSVKVNLYEYKNLRNNLSLARN
ncbi:uncharacterized protein DUF3108 [Pontibacter ummariensis]|uniref:DUF3108 domain-containing protein n=1 Tax=Pontibacter ummariensis TaxID=1610492 RepID=A0A239B3M4_9BACT|nr:DUF3108 domain-containing protein [Pontibacter ummariensis]PRY16264.1 uncharacterized protein DUF3108 [Pontibacter ummariensis]SNS02142.1 Protein of unknown function [Pontibacter ummariensis]